MRGVFGQNQLECRESVTAIHIYPEADHNFLARSEDTNRVAAPDSWAQMITFTRTALIGSGEGF